MRFRNILVLLIVIITMGSFVACDDIEDTSWEDTSWEDVEIEEVSYPDDETESSSDETESSSNVTLADVFSGLFTVCEHTETVNSYSFQPRNSSAYNRMQTECKDCGQVLYRNIFENNPSDLSYLDVLNNGEHFVEGEYYTIDATVQYNFFDHDLKVKCVVEKDDVSVFFTVTFAEEYKEASGLLQEGDVITFRGKSAPEGRLYWTDCELIAE